MPGSSAAMNNVQLTSADGAAKHNQKGKSRNRLIRLIDVTYFTFV